MENNLNKSPYSQVVYLKYFYTTKYRGRKRILGQVILMNPSLDNYEISKLVRDAGQSTQVIWKFFLTVNDGSRRLQGWRETRAPFSGEAMALSSKRLAGAYPCRAIFNIGNYFLCI